MVFRRGLRFPIHLTTGSRLWTARVSASVGTAMIAGRVPLHPGIEPLRRNSRKMLISGPRETRSHLLELPFTPAATGRAAEKSAHQTQMAEQALDGRVVLRSDVKDRRDLSQVSERPPSFARDGFPSFPALQSAFARAEARRMTPADFIAKWKRSTLTERSACQQHFLDLCDVLNQPKPAQVDPTGAFYNFERGVRTSDAGRGWAVVWLKNHCAWEYKGKHKDLTAAYRQLLQYREDLGNPPLLIVCDMDRFEVHTNFTATTKRVCEFDLDGLADPAHLDVLCNAFAEPVALRHMNHNRLWLESVGLHLRVGEDWFVVNNGARRAAPMDGWRKRGP